MFSYEICNVFDESIFFKQCVALEKHIPALNKISSLIDVDGSQIATYEFQDGKQLQVENDALFGVRIDSEVEIEKYFS